MCRIWNRLVLRRQSGIKSFHLATSCLMLIKLLLNFLSAHVLTDLLIFLSDHIFIELLIFLSVHALKLSLIFLAIGSAILSVCYFLERNGDATRFTSFPSVDLCLTRKGFFTLYLFRKICLSCFRNVQKKPTGHPLARPCFMKEPIPFLCWLRFAFII